MALPRALVGTIIGVALAATLTTVLPSTRNVILGTLYPLQTSRPTRVIITRSGMGPPYKSHRNLDFTLVVANSREVTALYHDILQLTPFPSGAISCPGDMGIDYTMVFYKGHHVLLRAGYDATGCQGVTYQNRAYWTADGREGAQFHQELRAIVGAKRFAQPLS